MNFEAYKKHQRRYEIGFWVAVIVLNVVANSVVVNIDHVRQGSGAAAWEAWVWESSSGILWLVLFPVLLAFDHRFPLRRTQLRQHLVFHLAFTVPFSLLHVFGMVGLRHVAYMLMASQYDFGNWPRQLFYEYLKDFRVYATFLGPIYLYRMALLRWQGEASLPDNNESDTTPADRFLVKKLGREFLVKTEHIEWLEAAGNYVNLHANGRVYPLRETMSAMERRLEGRDFARVHRSAILNLDRVVEIEPFESGDAQARLDTGALVPVSRRYRAELRDRLG